MLLRHLTTLVILMTLTLTSSSPLPRHLRARDHPRPRVTSRPNSTSTSLRAMADYLLPLTIRPLEYDINLIPYFETPESLAFTFDGTIQILIEASTATNQIRLHAGYDLNVLRPSVVVKLVGGAEVGVSSVVQADPSDDRDFLNINLRTSLVQNARYTVDIEFWGHLNDDLEGFYRTSYVNKEGVKKWVAVTHMQSVSARRAFPCWDEPTFKAKFTMHIAHGRDHNVLNNMPSDGPDTPVEGMLGWQWSHFQQSVLMSSYLVAFSVSEFVSKTNAEDPRFKVWAQPGRVEEAVYTDAVAPKLIRHMEEFTGILYTLPKLDQIAVPGFASGAMENWGLVTYKEPLMLFEPGVSTEQDRENQEAIVAHELAHQWFGNLVSPKWWDNLWLNEGFAVYFEYNALTSDIEPEWQMEERFVYERMHYVFLEDSLSTTHPILGNDIGSPYETYDMFDGIAYSKGACMVRFLISLMGEANFRSGIRAYLTNNQFSNADMDDLWAGLAPAVPPGVLPSDATLKDVMDTWTLQAGYPVVRVTRDYFAGTATVTQKRFVTDSASFFPEVFAVPVTLTSAATPDFEDLRVWGWQRGPELVISGVPATNDQWIIANLKQVGYYRVNYDLQNWALLAAGLRASPSSFPQINRGQLLNDALNLARAEQLAFAAALELTDYLGQETDFMPWSVALDDLVFVNLRMNKDQESRGLYESYMVSRLDAVFWSVDGFSVGGADSHVTLLKRPLVLKWACQLGHVQCGLVGAQNFQAWLATADPDNNNPIVGDLRDVTYCAGMRSGGQAEFDFLFTRYANAAAENFVEQERIETALGCSSDLGLLTKYLEASIDRQSPLNGRFCHYAVSDNPLGTELALDFLIQNWNAARLTYGGLVGIGRTFINIAPKLNTVEQRDKMQVFLDTNSAELGEAAADVASAIATLDLTLAWHAAHGEEVLQYFRSKVAARA